jgi:hypothetical protein
MIRNGCGRVSGEPGCRARWGLDSRALLPTETAYLKRIILRVSVKLPTSMR